MKTTFLSPGIYNIETDLTQQLAAPQQIGAAFIGASKRGPAFRPTQFQSFSQFRAIFGGYDTKMYVPYAVRSYIANAPIGTMVRVLGKGNPSNGYTVDNGRAFVFAFGTTDVTNTVASAFTASLSAVETVAILRSRQVSGVDTIDSVSYTGTAQSFTADIGGTLYKDLSLDRTRKNYIKNILGTDPKEAHFGDSATGVYVDAVWDYRVGTYTGSYTGSAYGALNNAASGSVSGIRYTTGGYKTAETPRIVSQPYVSGTAVTVYDLFKLVSRTDGEASNKDVKISIVNVETSTINYKTAPKFTILVRDYTDTDKRPVVLETFRVDLNPESAYFVSKVIGDRYEVTTIPTPGGVPETVSVNDYPNRSNFVRVELYEGYNFDARPAGFRGPKSINPYVALDANGNYLYESDMPLRITHVDDDGYKTNKTYLGFKYEGTGAIGFEDRLKGTVSSVDGTVGSRGFMILATTGESTASYNTPSLSAAYNQSLTSGFTMVDVAVTGSATIVQNGYQFTLPLLGGHDGIPPSIGYDKAINDGTLSAEFISALATLANPFQVDLNLLLVPGVHSGASVHNGAFVSRAIEMCEDRMDCFYIADLGKTLDTSATNITTDAMSTSTAEIILAGEGYDTSYAAAYYPWIRIFDDAAQKLIFVPPSVEMAGVYSFTDKVAQPWFAPAGFNRGSLDRVPEVRRKLTQTDNDLLYPGRINPIVHIVGQGPVVYGQKTLQKTESDLSDVNIRRLLITIEKTIAGLARTQLFEFNDPKGRSLLRNAINAYLERVQAQRGIANFRLTIDESNNTPEVIDRNQMKGLLLIQPTHVSEMIIFNYVLSKTGLKLEEVAAGLL